MPSRPLKLYSPSINVFLKLNGVFTEAYFCNSRFAPKLNHVYNIQISLRYRIYFKVMKLYIINIMLSNHDGRLLGLFLPQSNEIRFWLTEKIFIFEMKQDIRTSQLQKIFLSTFTTVKVYLTFLESMMT